MGRLSSMILLLAAFAGCRSAPATFIQPGQYYLLQPQPATLKIQPQLIQPIQHLKLEPKQQFIYYYPSVPLGSELHSAKPIRLITLKQDETPWWENFINFWKPPGEAPAEGATEAPESPAAPEAPAAPESPAPEAPAESAKTSMKQHIFIAPTEVEQFLTKTVSHPQGQRYYILSGTPQFFGNFDALQNPLSPIFSLQPLQALHARSNSEIQAEGGQLKFLPQIVTSNAPIAPVPALVPAQLKNDLLESHPDKTPTIERTWGRSLDDEPAPEEQPQQPQVQGRSLSEEPSEQNSATLTMDESKKEEMTSSLRKSDEPAIAAAKPAGIALAGRGGLAAAAPTGTAIVGNNGLALSSPTATSVAGNFFGDEDEEEKKN
ncbi:uncharacterized protein LOC129770446 [Toxorhynchites rutilus septentrionalis]|uniref:uncharacterized protein LOC129770446 n=1 Tax=Toxorhynchites rutilus septentrionalis TaxID=329112 RepID=UPI00247A7B9A|nr:uncharacterized protein LOC129770446 [Toxorhynchites rutilus septentrionalis]